MIRCVHCMQTISATHPPTPLFRALFGVVSCRVVSFPFFSKFKKERRKEKKGVVFNLPLPPPLSVFSLALVASRRIASHCIVSRRVRVAADVVDCRRLGIAASVPFLIVATALLTLRRSLLDYQLFLFLVASRIFFSLSPFCAAILPFCQPHHQLNWIFMWCTNV